MNVTELNVSNAMKRQIHRILYAAAQRVKKGERETVWTAIATNQLHCEPIQIRLRFFASHLKLMPVIHVPEFVDDLTTIPNKSK